MPTQEDIAQQQRILDAHRRTLATYLLQRTRLGADYAPPAVINGIIESRAEILRIKDLLRGWGVAVEDHPDDVGDALVLTDRPPSANWAVTSLWAWLRSFTPRERRLWSRWVLAGAFGWSLVGLAQIMGWLGEWGAPVFWGLATLAQWRVLGSYGRSLPLWSLTGVLGGVVAMALRLGAGGVGGWFVGTAVGWGAGSLAQSILLRRYSARATWWALVSIGIGILSWQISRAALQVVFKGLIAQGFTVSYEISNMVAVAVYWALAGAVYAALTGPLLVWLLRSPRTASAAATPAQSSSVG